jgi:hypothetical protein
MNPSNRLALDYPAEAGRFRSLSQGIIDIHSHLQGEAASALYAQAAGHFGIARTYTMTPLTEVATVHRTLGERVRFIAIPTFNMKNARASFGPDFMRDLPEFKRYGARIAKFWNAPRIYEASAEPFAQSPFRLNAPERIETMKAAADLGMIFMVHIGDPDTWFATKYLDAARYGTKLEQYETFEDVLSRFNNPWIAAHMGGYPENLSFLSGLLSRYPNLYLDCSATKWIVRELSKHPPVEVRHFFSRWRGRILFGSDIVARDSHLSPENNGSEMDAKASNHHEAYDLYASRYWALRTLFESSYEGPSPIADPDLHMVDPQRHSPLDAPTLRGCALDDHSLEQLYWGTAQLLGV